MADPRITQDPVEVSTSTSGKTTVTQDAVEVPTSTSGKTITTHAPVEVVNYLAVPPIWGTHLPVEVVGKNLFDDDHICVYVVTG